MSQQLDLNLNRIVDSDTLLSRTLETWETITGKKLLARPSLVQIKNGDVVIPDPSGVGYGDALYYMSESDEIPLVRLSTYCNLDDDWQPQAGPATRASISIPFGSCDVAVCLAASLAAALAILNSSKILDRTGFWTSRAKESLESGEFMSAVKAGRVRLGGP